MRAGLIKLAILFIVSSCFFQPDKVETFGLDQTITKGASTTKASIVSVSIVNDQLVINGSSLSGINNVRITGPSGFDETLTIESQSSSSLVANGLRHISIAIGAVFNLIISDAQGAATFQVTFTLQDGSVTANKLSDMGAGIGQILKFDGTSWIPGDLGNLVYAGNWDANVNSPDLSLGGLPGEYRIVTVAGSYDLNGGIGTDSWNLGDWVIWNDQASQWEKINNASNVTSFSGRSGPVVPQAGDYTWAQIDKTSSLLSDISDVDVAGLSDGQVLKWDSASSTWVAANDEDGATTSVSSVGANAPLSSTGGTTPTISLSQATTSTDGYLSQTDWNTFNSKLDPANATLTADLDMGSNNIINAGTINGISLSGLSGDIAANTTLINNLDTDDISEGVTNLYFSDSLAQAASVVDSTVGNETNRAPSVSAIKAYVGTQIASTGGGDFLADGTVAMTGNFDAGSNSLVNVSNISLTGNATLDGLLRLKDNDTTDHFVEINAPASLSTDLLLTLPATIGASGDVLTTDGTGVLSWQTPSSGEVVSVTVNTPLVNSGTATEPDITITQATTTVDGYLSSTDWNLFNNKEPAISAGAVTDYYRGNKTWATLNTAAVTESPTHLYFTDQRAIDAVVSSTITNGVTNASPSEDVIFDALATKLDSTTAASTYVEISGDTMTGSLNLPLNGLVVGTSQLALTGGFVGVGTASPTVELEVSGDIKYTGTITDVSDERLKEDILPLEDAMDKIRKTRPYSYIMKNSKDGLREYGFMAQDIQKILPELVHQTDEKSDYLSLNYIGLIPWALMGLKELDQELLKNQKMIQALRADSLRKNQEIQALKKQNQKLESRIVNIEQEMIELKRSLKEVLSQKSKD